ncbi:peptide chain release factor N(5)-glutamine methyltransferase [Verrucomicrobiales bacterium BCK34]|nr:peptide chain release factor N(5)-glutamine methyltransferase [Verrucomicrobiales bacterium BCK34]
MATILDTLKKGTEYLEKYGIEDPRLNMEHLIAHVLKVTRMQLYVDFDKALPEPALVSLRELTKRRSKGEPLQHLLGSVEFCELEFSVDGRALIPRPETEELVHLLLQKEWPRDVRILDLGCGSGVIGLSLAHHLADKGATVSLADVSTEALALAQENATNLEITNVNFVESDLFSAIDSRFDLIVANLPYIPDAEQTQLSREVQRDPALALYGGELGTEIITRFLHEVSNHLTDSGQIGLEYGIDQHDTLKKQAEDLAFEPVTIKKDLNGIERFLFATKTV